MSQLIFDDQYSTAVNFFSSHRHFYSLSTCQFVLHILRPIFTQYMWANYSPWTFKDLQDVQTFENVWIRDCIFEFSFIWISRLTLFSKEKRLSSLNFCDNSLHWRSCYLIDGNVELICPRRSTFATTPYDDDPVIYWTEMLSVFVVRKSRSGAV
jgi:hypothetical protein